MPLMPLMPLRLSGLNVDGWFVAGATPEHLGRFMSDGDLAQIASWRLTHLRLPVDDALLDEPAAWAALDGALDGCARNGLGCVLALRTPQTGLFAGEARWRPLIQRWETLAARFAQWPGGVLYDLLDCPDPPDDLPEETLRALGAARLSSAAARRAPAPGATAGRAWSALAARLTQAIRGVDQRHGLVVQAVRAGPAGFAHLRPTRDAATVYSFHCFAPEAFTRQGMPPHPPAPSPSRGRGAGGEGALTYPGVIDGERWDRQRVERWLQPALDFAATYDAPLYLGAFGVSAAAQRQSQLTWVRSVLGLCHRHGIGWAYWTYRAYPGAPFGLVCDLPPWADLAQFQNPQRLDYDLLGVLQSEA